MKLYSSVNVSREIAIDLLVCLMYVRTVFSQTGRSISRDVILLLAVLLAIALPYSACNNNTGGSRG